MSLNLSNIIRNRSRAASDASTANTVPSNSSNNPQPVLDFTTRIDELKKSYIGRDGNGNRQHFVPEKELVEYWTKPKVREISQAYTPHLTIKFDLVNKRCLRLFSLLVYIDRLQFFENLQSKILDAQLPVAEDNLPQILGLPVYKEVLRDLLKHQWLFCPLVLDYALLTDLHLQTDHILPFSDEKKLKDGDAAHIFKITVNKTCNRLEGQVNAAEDHIYVLKSYSHECYRKLYLNESKALTTLQQPGSEHIVGYYGSFTQNGTFNLLLQFADAGNLLDYYGEITPPSDSADIRLFWNSLLGILKGLHCVHQLHPSGDESGEYRGIHEDIKPDNIILNNGPSKSPYDFVPLLADFGHSHFRVPKSEDDDMGVDRQGNQTYGAPESSRHARYLLNLPGQIPTSADIFSVGCVLSDAAAWVVFGTEGRDLYRSLRIEAGRQVESFEDESFYDCFHNALDRSKAVDDMHTRIREECRSDDTATPLVLDLVEDHMLIGDWKKRLASRELYERFRQSERKKKFMTMATSKVEDVKAGIGRLAKELSDTEPFRHRRTDMETPIQDSSVGNVDDPNPPDSDSRKRSPRPPAIEIKRGLSNPFRRNKEGITTTGNDKPAMFDAEEDYESFTPLPPIKTSASPTLPVRRPGPHPHIHIPDDTSSLSLLSDSRNSFSTSYMYTLSPPSTEQDLYDGLIPRPPTPTQSVEDVTLTELTLTLEEARQWRGMWKNYEQLPPDKHRIIRILQHSLRGRDHIFFVDDSRAMKQHAAEVEIAFETLAYIVKPQDGKERGNVSLALGQSGEGKGKKQNHFYTDNSKTTNLLNVLKKNCTYERIETMMEDAFSDFIHREIIPRLPLLNPHREANSLGETARSTNSKRSSSASRIRGASLSTQNSNPISIIVFTDGRWGDGDSGAGVDNPIWRLIDQLKERGLKRTQVMIQFVRFGNDQDGVRHLNYLAKMGIVDSDKRSAGYSIVDTQPITGNVCAMLIGSVGGTHKSANKTATPAYSDSYDNPTSILQASSRIPRTTSNGPSQDQVYIEAQQPCDNKGTSRILKPPQPASESTMDTHSPDLTTPPHTISSRDKSSRDKKKIVRLLCNAIRRPHIDALVGDKAHLHPTVQQRIADALGLFFKHVKGEANDDATRDALELIDSLRSDIAARYCSFLFSSHRSWRLPGPRRAHRQATIPVLHSNSRSNKHGAGTPVPDERPLELSDASEESELEWGALVVGGIDINELVASPLEDNPEFGALIRIIEEIVEQFASGDNLAVIEARVLSAMKRGFVGDRRKRQFRVIFQLHWKLEEYLQTNYDAGVSQNLADLVGITGVLPNAQLCTVAEYFKQVKAWTAHTTELLQALRMALDKLADFKHIDAEGYPTTDSSAGNIEVDLHHNTVLVDGSDEFIVTVAQQLAWLTALTRDTVYLEESKYAYVCVKETFHNMTKYREQGGTVFDISVDLESAPLENDASCWTKILGPSIVITGYPIAERQHSERGLEASARIMTALAGIPIAVTFGGGFVFKGRHHAMVPERRFPGSIQWHVISSTKRELEWEDILKQCPERLLHHDNSDEMSLWEARSFFGWCPSIVSDIATNEFKFDKFENGSGSRRLGSLQFEVSKASLGFNKWASVNLEFTLRRRKGVTQDERSDDYEWVLRSAREMVVILHGIDRRAIQCDGEEMILHILLHRWRQWAANGPEPDRRTPLESACPARHRTVRAAMHVNANKVFRTTTRTETDGPDTKAILFKEEVVRTYHLLARLKAGLYTDTLHVSNKESNEGSSVPVSFPSAKGRSLQGWEYLDVVKDITTVFQGRCITLEESSGSWGNYARDIKAIPLFTTRLGNIMRPEHPELLCRELREFPNGKSYLAIRAATLSRLFQQCGSLNDQTRLTDSGLSLFGRSDIFGPCSRADSSGQSCNCCRIQWVRSTSKTVGLRRYFKRREHPWDFGPKAAIRIPESPGCVLVGKEPFLARACSGFRAWIEQQREILNPGPPGDQESCDDVESALPSTDNITERGALIQETDNQSSQANGTALPGSSITT